MCIRDRLRIEFDRAMLKLVRRYSILSSGYAYNHKMDTENKTVVFSHRDVVFVFNWHPDRSLPDYPIQMCIRDSRSTPQTESITSFSKE